MGSALSAALPVGWYPFWKAKYGVRPHLGSAVCADHVTDGRHRSFVGLAVAVAGELGRQRVLSQLVQKRQGDPVGGGVSRFQRRWSGPPLRWGAERALGASSL